MENTSFTATRHPADWQQPDYYAFWHADQVRFADLDALGHVNNNSYGVYFEAARIAFVEQIYPRFWQHPALVVLKAISIEYVAELHFPNAIKIGVRPLRVGTSSFTSALAVFAGDVCYATAMATGVTINPETRQPMPVPPDFRNLFLQHA